MITNIMINRIDAKILKRGLVKSFDTRIDIRGAEFSGNTANFGFRWTAQYSPNIGYISMDGIVCISETPERIKQLVSEWKKKKSVPGDFTQEITNGINYYCTVNSPLIAKAMEVQPPINVPILNAKKQGSR